ncbi:unnamed protein product [Arctogadus glacialis]
MDSTPAVQNNPRPPPPKRLVSVVSRQYSIREVGKNISSLFARSSGTPSTKSSSRHSERLSEAVGSRPAYFIGCLCITPCISSSRAPCPMGSPGNELVTVETLGWRPREKKDGSEDYPATLLCRSGTPQRTAKLDPSWANLSVEIQVET